MNKKNKTRLKKVISGLQMTPPDFSNAQDEIEDVLADEEMSKDNMEEYFSETERYQIISDNCDALDEALGYLDANDPECVGDVIDALCQIDGV